MLSCSLAPVITNSLTWSFLSGLAGLDEGAEEFGAVEELPM
jgi:hypothetical protein